MSLPPVCVQCEAPLIEGAPIPGEGVGAPEGAGAAGLAGEAAAELAAGEQDELAWLRALQQADFEPKNAAAEADEAGGVDGGLAAQDGIPAVPTETTAAGMDTLTAAGCMDTAVATPASATSSEVVKQQSLSKSGPPSPVAHASSSGQLSHFLIPTNLKKSVFGCAQIYTYVTSKTRLNSSRWGLTKRVS